MAEEGRVLIKDLPEALSVADSSFIPVDNGSLTQKISVENFNESSNQTAKAYAQAAAGSANTAQEAIADVNNKVDTAQGYANTAQTQAGYAQTYANNAQTYSGNAQGYANSAQGSATNAAASATAASSSADAASDNAVLARSWAEGNTGTRQGENTNNARYWASKAETAARQTIDDHLDPQSTNPVENQAIYNAIRNVHASGSNILITTSEPTLKGKNCVITDGTETYTESFDQTGKAKFEGVMITGALTITATDGDNTLTDYLTTPYFGNYTKEVAFWSANITVTTTTSQFNGLTVYAKKNGVVMGSDTFVSGSATIKVPETGTYTLEITLDWKTYNSSATVTDETGTSTTFNGFIAPIALTTTTTEFYGESIAVTLDGVAVTTPLAFDNSGEASFDALQAGVYVFTVTYGGEPYTSTVTVSAETSYNAPEIKMWTATINLSTSSSQLQLQPISVYRNGSLVTGTNVSFNASGNASYIAHESGTYEFTCEWHSYPFSSGSVSVSEETTYSATIDVFYANLAFTTTSPDLYSQTITVKKGASTVGTTAFNAQGTAPNFEVHETGTYTGVCTYQGETYSSDEITIASGDIGQTKTESIDTIPDGSIVTPTDDIQTWLKCAGIRDKSYTMLAEVLADHETLYILMGSNNAVDYLVRSTTWVSGITSDETAMKYIGKWNYASDTLLADDTWRTAIVGSTYASSIINASVPNMASINQPSGVVTSGTTSSTNSDWKAFDGDTSTFWAATNQTQSGATSAEDWIGYEFDTPTECAYAVYTGVTNTAVQSYSIKASEDGTTFDIVLASGTTLASQTNQRIDFTQNVGKYKYYRMYLTQKWTGSGLGAFPRIAELQFYGRTDVTEGIDVYGAAFDTMTVTGNGTTLTITTDPSGHYIVPKTSLPNDTYTFTSGVAKDPTNLSNDYSKSVTVTDGTAEIYVMPDNTLYWWGYIDSNLENVTTANGWSYTATLSAPTYNLHDIETKKNTDIAMAQGVGTASAVQLGTVNFVAQGVSKNGYDNYGRVKVVSEKNITTTSPIATTTVTSTALTKLTSTPSTSGEYYFAIYSGAASTTGSQNMKTFAIWLE